jgi:hypothetical protein
VAPLIVGTLLALGALAYVLWPLVVAAEARPTSARPPSAPLPSMADDHGAAVAALREIEFDHVTGKLSEPDYVALKARYTAEAVAAMRAREGEIDDPVEAEIRRARAQTRVCPVCGPRPEPGACYCSRCGRALA